MHRNSLPQSPEDLLELGSSMAHGLEIHRSWIGVSEDVTAGFRAMVERLRQTSVAVANARNTRVLATKRIALSDKVLKTWLTKARLVVMLARGARWSESWIHTGFTERRTQVPRKLEDRITLAQALVSFFARHPEFGVNFAEVTAARGRAIYERVVQSCEMLHFAKNDCAVTKQDREAAENELRDTLRELIPWLKTHFDRSDPRWTDFGLIPHVSCKRRSGRIRRNRTSPIPFLIQLGHASHGVAAA
jgi:hypothetical protein